MEVRRSNITAAKGTHYTPDLLVLADNFQGLQMQFDQVWDQREWTR
jgi:hypothetical protein